MITKSYDTLPQCAKDIRINVFINEQGFKEEFDELDGISNHLVTFDGNKPCGLYPRFTAVGTVIVTDT